MSFRWKQILYLIQDSSSNKYKSRVFKSFSRKRFGKISVWLLFLTAVVAMLCWNWKLLLATGAGVGLMLLVYVMQGWDWKVHWSDLQRFLSGSNRQLSLAVGSGGIAALSTYIAASIWAESENRWLATGLIIQGFGTLFTLVLLLWHIVSHQVNQDEGKFELLLNDLTDIDPLKRLFAVRQLTRLATNTRLSQSYRCQLGEYFRLMLSYEKETIIRNAVFESLQVLDTSQLRTKENQPLQIPITLKHELD
ncbi:MAG: hypothetical protein F6K10_00980 [Moorea sp. SIO2B7]|nr:hypothetical protein [Moorena sp. SIO2B7]